MDVTQKSALTESFLELLGRLHPLAVHFPIALLLVAVLVEFLRIRREDKKPSPTLLLLLSLGALGAAFATLSGWTLEERAPHGSAVAQTIFFHRWIGVGTAGFALIGALFAWAARWGEAAWLATIYRGCLLLAALGVIAGGYLGGELVYGEGYLTDAFDVKVAKEEEASAISTPEEPAADPESQPESPAGEELELATPVAPEEEPVAAVQTEWTYAAHVQPILEAKCYECHGPRKKKAGLRLDEVAELSTGDPADWIITPGDPRKSLLMERVLLPAEHEDRMPPKGDPLPAQEIAILEAWIAAGASQEEAFTVVQAESEDETPSVAEVPTVDTHLPLVESQLVPLGGTGGKAATEAAPELGSMELATLGEAEEALLVQLRERGANAGPLAAGSPLVEVDFSLLGAEVTDADLDLLRGLELNLVWLNLSGTAVTDEGVQALSRFPNLERVKLSGTAIGDPGLEAFANARHLTLLNLYDTRVGDAGLAHLEELPALRKLYLWQTAVTEDGIAKLQASQPRLVIVGDELARLAETAAEEAEKAGEEVWHVPCCLSAKAKGAECDHPCCVAAAKTDESCTSCRVAGPAPE